MTTDFYWSWELPSKLEGAAVVVDVYAASTNIAAFLRRGVSKLYLVNDETIQAVKSENPQGIAIGESLTLPKDLFVSNNWPANVAVVEVTGKTVIYMSNNGTRVIQEAMEKGARTVITAGFVNMDKTIFWLRQQNESQVTLIAAGEISLTDQKVMEDIVCAQTMGDMLAGKKVDPTAKFKDLEEFMKTVYKGTKEDRTHIDLTLAVNSLSVVPLCRRMRPGVIEVIDALHQQEKHPH